MLVVVRWRNYIRHDDLPTEAFHRELSLADMHSQSSDPYHLDFDDHVQLVLGLLLLLIGLPMHPGVLLLEPISSTRDRYRNLP